MVEKELTRLLADLQQRLVVLLGDRVERILLFGSRARGDHRPESDWDLLVIAQGLPERPFDRHLYVAGLLPLEWGAEISIMARSPQEFEAHLPSLYLDIALDGKILYDPRGYAAERLAAVIHDPVDADRRRAGRQPEALRHLGPGRLAPVLEQLEAHLPAEALEVVSEGAGQAAGARLDDGRVDHHGDPPARALDEPLGHQRADGLPRGEAAHAELARQAPLRGQLGADLDLALGDPIAQDVGDLDVDRERAGETRPGRPPARGAGERCHGHLYRCPYR